LKGLPKPGPRYEDHLAGKKLLVCCQTGYEEKARPRRMQIFREKANIVEKKNLALYHRTFCRSGSRDRLLTFGKQEEGNILPIVGALC